MDEITIHSRVFILDLPANTVQSCEIGIIYCFWRDIGLFLVCLTVEEKEGMPENYTVDLLWTKKK
jgi:hypothetical protein